MEMEFNSLIDTLKKFNNLKIINKNVDSCWIQFSMDSQETLENISVVLLEIKEQYPCNLLVLSNKKKPEDFSYKLIIESQNRTSAINLINKKLKAILESSGDIEKAKQKELGLPDLSLVTIRQIAIELKRRSNLTFAFVWIENNERDNIAIEGSGNPTQLVGLLARGSHMAIEWADKNIKFYKPSEDE
jgi:hypothetical protein